MHLKPESMSNTDLERELLGVVPTSGNTALIAQEPALSEAMPNEDGLLRRRLEVARELLSRDLLARLQAGPAMSSPAVIKDWLRMRMAHFEQEVFMVIFLNSQNKLICFEEMFYGTLTQTSVYPREVVKMALARNAASVVLAHNHPSSDTNPSRADEHLTCTLKTALALVDVRVLDHFVVGAGEITSFAERGLL